MSYLIARLPGDHPAIVARHYDGGGEDGHGTPVYELVRCPTHGRRVPADFPCPYCAMDEHRQHVRKLKEERTLKGIGKS
jgi:rRNA maturation protein Nop10